MLEQKTNYAWRKRIMIAEEEEGAKREGKKLETIYRYRIWENERRSSVYRSDGSMKGYDFIISFNIIAWL